MAGEGKLIDERKPEIEEEGEQKRRNSRFLDRRSPPSLQSQEFSPTRPPPASSLSSSEDDNESHGEIDADRVKIAPLLHVFDMTAKEEDHVESQTIPMNVVADDGGLEERRPSGKEHELHWEDAGADDVEEQKVDHTEEDDDTDGSSEQACESGQVSDATESDSMDSVAYARWAAEGTDSSYSSSSSSSEEEKEEEYGMKSSFDAKRDGKGPATSRASGRTSEKKKVAVGEGNRAAPGEETEIVPKKSSNSPIRLMFALVALAVLLLLLLPLLFSSETCSHLPRHKKAWHLHNCSFWGD